MGLFSIIVQRLEGLYPRPLGRRGRQRARSAVLTYEWVGSQGLQCLARCTLHSVIEASTEVSFRSKGANFAWHATCIMASGHGKINGSSMLRLLCVLALLGFDCSLC